MKLSSQEILNRLTAIARARGEKLTVRKMDVGWRVGFGTDLATLASGRTLRAAALAALRKEEVRVDAG